MTGNLAGKRVLVVEDEYFIASDLKRALQNEDAIVIGPTGDLSRGMRLAEGETLDAAVLDVNLEGATSYAIADRLVEQEVPYMFLTGYDAWALPPAYQDAPRISKPFPMHELLRQVARLVGSGEPS